MKMALYIRVSTRKQQTENQKIILEEYAKKQNWKYDIYEEEESTRKTRPIKYDLFTKLREGFYDGVCFYKLDRWARSVSEGVKEIDELVKRGVSVIDYSGSITFTPDKRTGQLPSMQ